MDRSEARAHAMKLVYEWEMGGDGGEDTNLNLLEVIPEENEAVDKEDTAPKESTPRTYEISGKVNILLFLLWHFPTLSLNILKLQLGIGVESYAYVGVSH